MTKKTKLSEKEMEKLKILRKGRDDDYFNTGLKLQNGWKIGKYIGNGDGKTPKKDLCDINSRSQIEVRKKDFLIRLNELDGRLGGGYTVKFDKNSPNGYDSVFMKYKKYDEALNVIHALMRMVN